MRWIWIDCFVEFEPGERATALKNITLAEEHLHDHFPHYRVMPPTLVIEGMAQTAGILVGEAREFKENVILAKVKRADFTGYGIPGDQLRYEATIESINDSAAMTSGLVLRQGEEIAQVDLIFSHVNQSTRSSEMPDHNFVFTGMFMDLLSQFRDKAKQESSTTHAK